MEEYGETTANLSVGRGGVEAVGGGGSMVAVAPRRRTSGSGELKPARLGPIAPLGLGEGERNLG